MIIQGKPVPDELKPLHPNIYRDFVRQILHPDILSAIQAHIRSISADWQVYTPNQQIAILDTCQDILFNALIPKPDCRLTFGRVRFTASFHTDDWSIRFSENYFRQRPFHKTFKTWLHESFHGLLNFFSLRVGNTSAPNVVKAPRHIQQIALQYPLPPHQQSARLIAEKNLLGIMDRYLSHTDRHWAGLDSYYLNVEIVVENLTEYVFRAILPQASFQRSYRTAEDYIAFRMAGGPPIKAASYSGA